MSFKYGDQLMDVLKDVGALDANKATPVSLTKLKDDLNDLWFAAEKMKSWLRTGTNNPTFDGIAIGPAGIIKWDNSFEIADNQAYSYVPSVTAGILDLAFSDAAFGQIYYNCETPYTQNIAVSASVNIATGPLTGTTGPDGMFTVSCHTDGRIYLENRLGAAVSTKDPEARPRRKDPEWFF